MTHRDPFGETEDGDCRVLGCMERFDVLEGHHQLFPVLEEFQFHEEERDMGV